MGKKILFRADGNSSIGLGHLYRLFAIVEMVKELYEFVYIVRASSTSGIIPNEYTKLLIPENVDEKEEPEWLAKRYAPKEHIIIADGYDFVSNYQKKIKSLGFSLVYIDDLVKEHMYADIVINHSPSLKSLDFSSESYTKFALGTEYSILRPFFIEKAKERKEKTSINNVFICFGGSDFYDLTYKSVEGVVGINDVKEIHVVLGGAYNYEDIHDLIKDKKDKVFIHRNLAEKEMLNIMDKCDLAIVPTSTICYEVCCVKMLIFGGYYVDNQINIYKGFLNNDVIYPGGDFKKYSSGDFKEKVEDIMKNQTSDFKKKLANQYKLFDGNQKKRFLKLLNELEV
ncbi:UDP-2,4-diacetamido-2,4,6-trideoxy-beta-L-altropyranose hydrolase [Aquimarina litoralis]|uniref:UDP-2,4-diacetamido-2,4, 6-trideoxy-beta-L-altropyranose hydrolase n=1 Tax=Aquimarina litoralis TaxID=584605 RepID=UPI001C56E3C5|nr:UDP-2,4-diacetamido-2,4,6-trideoxy-beta-L-altropyranose hydrolase [Aquimarina litoralis]MBW1293892.1 UDP-2,4-diacetamido-2,4,6-trideoxy-beta-L-altropyranose hydrolase [Aquimarina litoralis]